MEESYIHALNLNNHSSVRMRQNSISVFIIIPEHAIGNYIRRGKHFDLLNEATVAISCLVQDEVAIIELHKLDQSRSVTAEASLEPSSSGLRMAVRYVAHPCCKSMA